MLHKMLRKGIAATLLVALAIVFGVFVPQTAHAHSAPLRAPKSMQAAMVIDCARSAPEAVKKIGACKDKSGVVQPDGTIGEADGNCGYARIELDVVGGADLFLLSHIGNIAIVHWGINWYNWTHGYPGSVQGDDPASNYTWSHYEDLRPGQGYVTATFGGQAVMVSGVTCTILNPTAGEYVG
jgi:hypothetical protein